MPTIFNLCSFTSLTASEIFCFSVSIVAFCHRVAKSWSNNRVFIFLSFMPRLAVHGIGLYGSDEDLSVVQFSKVVNAGFITSAWSAATSDIYVSSR